MNLEKSVSQRRYELDWLRVLLILVVFVFHTGRFFDTWDWHVKNPQTYSLVQLWTSFLASWNMPLIFVVSGASLYFAVGKGGPGKFIGDKILRLFVPLIVGVFTHISLAVYLERLTHHQFFGSYFEFFPEYFQGLYGNGGNFAWMGLHLWYLLILFIFCLVFLPLIYLLKGSGQGAVRWLGRVLSRPGVMYLLVLPVIWIMLDVSPRSVWGVRNWGGWSLLAYIPFFLYGFVIMASEEWQATIQRWRWGTLILTVLTTACLVYFGIRYGRAPFGSRGYDLVNGFFSINAWMWALLAFGFAIRHLNFTNAFLKYANEAVLPFYILHQTALLCIGYFVVRWNIPAPAKFLVIGLSSFVLSLGIYELLIRRFNWVRFLFGMKPQIRSRTRTSPSSLEKSQANESGATWNLLNPP